MENTKSDKLFCKKIFENCDILYFLKSKYDKGFGYREIHKDKKRILYKNKNSECEIFINKK